MSRTGNSRAVGKWRKRLLRCGLAAAAAPIVVLFCFQALSWLFPYRAYKLRELRARRESTQVLDREGNLLRSFLGRDDSRLFWVGLEEINPLAAKALIAVEDERYEVHPGVDPIAVARAGWSNLRHGRIVSGASTLTMQTVRMVEPHPRTYAWKAVEAFRALQLERLRTKRQLLEIYLNIAPFGGNLVGIEAGALAYFGKHARDLTLAESALLVGLVQSPSRLRPDRHPERARKRRDHVLKRMRLCGYITEAEQAFALRQPVVAHRGPFPFAAPHFARMVYARRHGSLARSTLDARAQGIAETALREQVAALRGDGVTNGAVVIIENDTAAVRALVGSRDFWSREDCGQINGALVRRSPGSALKPFVYALAFERGVLCPSEVLGDVPRSFSGYMPVNYDREWRGPVSARAALRDSLNMPAVAVLQRVGVGRLHGFLQECGLTTVTRAPESYGLSLALGSAEVRLVELTNAYAALARMGVYRPYRMLETEEAVAGERVLSKEAAWLVADCLTEMRPLVEAGIVKSERHALRLAWKTGTSHGHRDAWCFAYTRDYTVGVWLGNFSGRPSGMLVGIKVAAPVAVGIMRQLHVSRAAVWPAQPCGVCKRRVCAVSGMPAGAHCPHTAPGLAIAGRSSREVCTVHVAARIDCETGRCLCPLCSRGRAWSVKVLEKWPAGLDSWFRASGGSHRLAPPHFAGCRAARSEGTALRISSPADGETYLLRGDGTAGRQLLLRATASAERLHWFVDGRLYATSGSSARLFWPLRAGVHAIACTDETGKYASVRITVR